MHVRLRPQALKQTRWHEYLLRFVFGGLVTAAAGWVAQAYGPVVGGLFLAFPAIFPASVTLSETHEAEKEQRSGHPGDVRGERAAGVQAAGAALGALGLVGFGTVVWWLAPRAAAWAVLAFASLTWLALSAIAWAVRQRI